MICLFSASFRSKNWKSANKSRPDSCEAYFRATGFRSVGGGLRGDAMGVEAIALLLLLLLSTSVSLSSSNKDEIESSRWVSRATSSFSSLYEGYNLSSASVGARCSKEREERRIFGEFIQPFPVPRILA